MTNHAHVISGWRAVVLIIPSISPFNVFSQDFFFFFFFLQVLRLYAALWVMTDFRYLYIHDLAWLFALSLSISAWSRRRHWYDCDFWVFPS